VIDISEQGIRFSGSELHEFEIGLEVAGKIVFYDGESLELEGKVVRVSKKLVIIYLSENIPFGRIAHEQRFIRDNYPDWFQE
jgi:hypothetical protein